MKSVNKLEQNFAEIKENLKMKSKQIDKVKLCDEMNKGILKKFYVKMERKLYEKTEDEDSIQCALSKLKSLEYAEDKMKESVFGAFDMKYGEVIAQNEKTCKSVMVPCILKHAFGVMFDFYLDNPNIANSDVATYCIKKYVVDNKLLDTRKYKIDVNPKSLKVANIFCTEINFDRFHELPAFLVNKFIKDDDFFPLDEDQFECAIEKCHEGKVTESFFIAGVLRDLKVTQNVRQAEREKFVRNLVAVASEIVECEREN